MINKTMKRKSFMKSIGKAGACVCTAAGGLRSALGLAPGQSKPGDMTPERAVKRMEFADRWVKRCRFKITTA